VAPHRDFGVDIKVRVAVAAAAEPVGTRNPAILYGVGNILENAVDFARNTVEVNAWWNNDTVEIVVSDDGPGFAPDILKRIGEPYLSRRRSVEDSQGGTQGGGLGLGVFIARTLLERTGAKVSFSNRPFPDHGAVVQIVWPRRRFEAGEETTYGEPGNTVHDHRNPAAGASADARRHAADGVDQRSWQPPRRGPYEGGTDRFTSRI